MIPAEFPITINVNNEQVLRGLGISIYEGEPVVDDIAQPWLRQDSEEVVDKLRAYSRLTLQAEVGGGKSAILFGARALLRQNGVRYISIDGHYKNSDACTVVSAIQKATSEDYILIYDSSDYLACEKKPFRSFPKDIHVDRNLQIINTLISSSELTLLLTSHMDNWIGNNSSELLEPAFRELLHTTTPHFVEIVLDDVSDRFNLLANLGLGNPEATLLSELPSNAGFIDHIARLNGDKKYINWAIKELKRYDTLKMIVRDNYEENLTLLETMNKAVKGILPLEVFWSNLLEYVFSKRYRIIFYTS